jgi:AcrR family transcriptional regulator
MPLEKSDRRVSRTRRQLREALMSLILEKGYDAVTVEDITSRADLGRTTFYLHYRDKEELLLESIDAIANDLKSQVDRMTSAGGQTADQPQPIHMAFHHAAEHADLYRIILQGEGATKTATRIRRIISSGIIDFLQARAQMTAASPTAPRILQMVADYFASALLGYLTWWLEEGTPGTPDEMADRFLDLFFNGARETLSRSA